MQGPGRLKPPAWAQSLLQDSWERARLGCVRGQVLVWTRGARIGGISQKEKEKIEALSGCLENSPQQRWPLAPLPSQPLDCEGQISSPSTHLKPAWRVPRSVDWAPTTETPVGAHPDQCPVESAHRPKTPGWVRTPVSGLGPTHETSSGCPTRSEAQLPGRTGPKQ